VEQVSFAALKDARADTDQHTILTRGNIGEEPPPAPTQLALFAQPQETIYRSVIFWRQARSKLLGDLAVCRSGIFVH
jgi:hypothetical protein